MIIILEFDELVELLNAVRYEHASEIPPTDHATTFMCVDMVSELLSEDPDLLKDVLTDQLFYLVTKMRRILCRAVSPMTPTHFRMVDPCGTIVIRID